MILRPIDRLKDLVRRVWIVRAPALLVLRPKRFRDEFVYSLIDYWRFRRSLNGFLALVRKSPVIERRSASPGLLIVAGRQMNVQWCQLWAVLGAVYRSQGYVPVVLTSRNEPIRNLSFRLMAIPRVFIEDLDITSIPLPNTLLAEINQLATFDDFKAFEIDGVPFGQISISTYGRLRATGIVDVTNSSTKNELRRWIGYLYQTMMAAGRLYDRYRIEMLFFTEVFMEEYGAFYYEALHRKLNVVRFAGTVRDDAIIVQHLNEESDRTHHAALSPLSWARIGQYADSPAVKEELEQNFLDRYGDRWALSRRNQLNTRIMSPAEARALLGIPSGRKVAVIFSHILYDTLFFFGEDLFPIYAEWFLATVKAACSNPNVQWFVKVHPSNLWRGDLEYYFGGKYEEVRLIERYIGELPEHVRLIYPDTPISPYTWFQITDYGVTVRGTSGIELAALGKTVITAGSGRYESIGFSINSQTTQEYLSLLEELPDIPQATAAERQLGVRFAYATFCMKPFTLEFLRPVPRTGRTHIFGAEDLVYLGHFPERSNELPESLRRFIQWSLDRTSVDFLNKWPANPLQTPSVEPIAPVAAE